MDNKIFNISNIKLINGLVIFGCIIFTSLILLLLSGLNSEVWFILFMIIVFIVQNIIGFTLTILFSPKVIFTFIILFVLLIIQWLVIRYNLTNIMGLFSFSGTMLGNIISGAIVLLIISINKLIKELKNKVRHNCT
jgi:hypothetical protein